MECLGGNGYVEEGILARHYRESPVNAIWEGSGNVQALDLLRALSRSPAVLEVWFQELAGSRGANAALDRAVAGLKDQLRNPADAEFRARHLADQLALTMQSHLLLQSGNGPVAEAFIASRLDSRGAGNYGTLAAGLDVGTLIQRAHPALSQ